MFFFFSSRRRHTRCSRDWSSDVCSSDLRATPARTPTMATATLPESSTSPRRGAPSRVATRLSPSYLPRSEEHTSELQSRLHLVCRLLLEKKKNKLPVDLPGHVLAARYAGI